MQKVTKIKIQKSSGNIFKNLGYENPEDTLAKVKIAVKINEIIAKKGYKQKETIVELKCTPIHNHGFELLNNVSTFVLKQ